MRSAIASNLRRTWPAAVAFVLAAVAATVLVGRPAGERSGEIAAIAAVQSEARPGSIEVLLSREWGDGEFVLVSHESMRGEHHLSIVFAIDQGRGWRAVRISGQRAEISDVKGHAGDVGSLLIASGKGGAGQPAWAAVFGELADTRVERVSVRWIGGQTTSSEPQRGAYLVMRRGPAGPELVRYLDGDTDTIAEVDVE